MRHGQAKRKTKRHGAIAGLPYTISRNGKTSTKRTNENINVFMDMVEETVKNPNSVWFEDGYTYQGGTNREEKAIYVLMEEKLAIFEQSIGHFITYCLVDEKEIATLYETKNFGGSEGWYSDSSQAKNFNSFVEPESS